MFVDDLRQHHEPPVAPRLYDPLVRQNDRLGNLGSAAWIGGIMTKGEQARLTAWRWKVLQQAPDELNVARLCRHFGISRKSFYK